MTKKSGMIADLELIGYLQDQGYLTEEEVAIILRRVIAKFDELWYTIQRNWVR